MNTDRTRSIRIQCSMQNFTEGYNMELGQGGVNVSGGQKQRLCIARALLKKPKILILDDSTSAVDTATEAKIRASFYTSLKDSTKIIIAQRISSVIEADKTYTETNADILKSIVDILGLSSVENINNELIIKNRLSGFYNDGFFVIKEKEICIDKFT